MKKIILSTMVALMAISTGFAQYYDGEPVGTTYEYEVSNPLMGEMKSTQTLESINANTIVFKNSTLMPGATEAVVVFTKFTIKDGKAYQDPQNIIESTKASMSQMLGGAEMNINLDGEAGFLPLVGKVGDKFEPFNYSLTMSTMGMEMTTKSEVTKFEVVREEEITTPAGTFNTFVLELDMKSVSSAMGQNQTFDIKQSNWIVPNKGIVKMEQTTAGQTVTYTLVKINK